MISELKPYSDYKSSGIEWLGAIPAHWESRPAFGVFMPNYQLNRGMKEKTVLSLSYGRIIVKRAEKLRGLVPESFETYQIVDPGDIVLRTTDLQNDHASLRVGMVKDRGIITSAYLALRVKSRINPEFGFQILNVWDSTKAIYGYGSGLRQNLDFSHFKRMPVAVPPEAEQVAIVRFLSWANARLESAILAKRKVIALLNEQKQAIIHRAVARGLDPDVRLKPSGAPWLGDVPQHWEMRPAFRVFEPRQERNIGLTENTVLSLSYGRIVVKPLEKLRGLVPESFETYQLLSPGDIVIRTTDLQNDRNSLRVGISRNRGIITSAYLTLRACAGVNSEYISRFLSAWDFSKAIYGFGSGLRQSLDFSHFKRMPVAVPPEEEQQKIVTRLGEEIGGIDLTIDRLKREVDLLQEYRCRLIADVVTGKLDVRGAATKIPEDIRTNTASEIDLGDDADNLYQEANE
jgi:type I restriction enzyme, S subunit